MHLLYASWTSDATFLKKWKQLTKKKRDKYEVMNVLTRWRNFFTMWVYQIIMTYTLNILQFCQLYLNKAGKKLAMGGSKKKYRASLVVQWLRICLPMQGTRFKPWSGKIPHAVEQLGPWATITEPARLEPVLRNKRGRDNERPAHRDEEWPPLAATRESPRTETKTQHSQK